MDYALSNSDCIKIGEESVNGVYVNKDIFNSMDNRLKDTSEVENELIGEKDHEAANFETAISSTGYGKFNILLLILVIPTRWAPIFEVTTTGYVFPVAQCDLGLTLEDKGLLNAITYAGMILSGFIWGFLFDKYGRKRLLIAGYFLNAICVILSSFSPNFRFLMVTKFIGGLVITGPDAGIASYFSELHSAKYRSIMVLFMGLSNAAGCIYLPVLAWYILPLDFEMVIAEGVVLHAWGLFFILNSVPSLMSCIAFLYMPESPKFLMSIGKNREALHVFKTIYSINTGRHHSSFPVTQLVEETQIRKENPKHGNGFLKGIKRGWNQMAPLFSKGYLKNFVLVIFLQVFLTLSLNTMRLWLPQIFQAINDYKYYNNGTSARLCEMLTIIQLSANENSTCSVNFHNSHVYVNSIIVATVSVVGYLTAGALMKSLGLRRLMVILSFLGGCLGIGVYYASNSIVITAFIAGFQASAGIGTNLVIVVIVNIFPTTLRTTTVSLVMMAARSAAMTGNIVFPYLLQVGCALPFFFLAIVIFVCCFLSLLIPKKDEEFK